MVKIQSASWQTRAAAQLELRRRGVTSEPLDPLTRLLSPAFTETLWEYEQSRTEPKIPGNLHPKQREVFDTLARHYWLFWGNQVGKTTIGAVTVVSACLGRHPVLNRLWSAPLTCWASALTWELWENILLPELLTWIPPDRLLDAPEPYKHSTKRHILIRADNGTISRITGKAAEQGAARYQSARVHIFWSDEEHPQSVWDEAQPRLLRHGGITLNTMTPLKGLTWVYHRIYEPWRKGLTEPGDHFVSHAGLADNPAIGPEQIEALDRQFQHSPAQLAARKFGHFVRPSGLALNYDPDKHLLKEHESTQEKMQALVSLGSVFAGIDFGRWRFAFTLWAVDRDGVVHCVDEVFSQKEDLLDRAQLLDDMLRGYGVPTSLRIWGDAANPTDIAEINSRLREVSKERDGRAYHVLPVAMDNKIRTASVERLNDLLGRGALKFRRGLMQGRVWKLGWNAASDGYPVEGSRLLWEMDNWKYPEPGADKAQKQDPDDNTADGADAIASMRYAIMSWWKAAKPEPVVEKPDRNVDPGDGLKRIFERAEKQKKAEERRVQRVLKQIRKGKR
jgi:phage terminase large subunit-like protein